MSWKLGSFQIIYLISSFLDQAVRRRSAQTSSFVTDILLRWCTGLERTRNNLACTAQPTRAPAPTPNSGARQSTTSERSRAPDKPDYHVEGGPPKLWPENANRMHPQSKLQPVRPLPKFPWTLVPPLNWPLVL